MYDDVVGRTQIYLGDDELSLLDDAARATGASRSELIRRAVRRTFGENTRAERLRALDASAGSWTDRHPAGADYVDELRGDLNERLRRLRVE
ncbi:MAG: CopG family transcriptional regulator [Thermoleophilaceae bacterium]